VRLDTDAQVVAISFSGFAPEAYGLAAYKVWDKTGVARNLLPGGNPTSLRRHCCGETETVWA
jgi:hypothetical protein